jgi:sugar-specific transcriptional regulator TrmB
MKKRTLLIRKPSHYASIASPRRSEIMASLGDAGPASAAELASRLGITSHSIYYHIRFLERAGVVKVQEIRKGPIKPEAIYALAAERILLHPNVKSQRSLYATRKALDSILRMASREIFHALESSAARSGQGREIVAVRYKARLSISTLRRVNRCLNDLENILRSSNRKQEKGKLYSLAIVLTPSRIGGKRT